MTRCDWDPSRIHSYVDNELTPDEALECERHLLECAACRATYEKIRAVVDVVRGARPLYEAPARSRAAAHALVAARHPGRGVRFAAAGFALAALCAVAVLLIAHVPAAPFADFATRTHRFYTQPSSDLEIVTSRPEAVSQWLAQRVSFRPGLPAHTPLPTDRYTLIGARLLRHDGRDVAYLRYELDRKPVSLLITTAGGAVTRGGDVMRSGALDFRFTTHDRLDLITWTDKGVDYCLVSESPRRGAESCIVCHPSADERHLIDNLRPLPAI